MTCDSTPAANMSPAGSKQQMGFPSVLTSPYKVKPHMIEELDQKGGSDRTLLLLLQSCHYLGSMGADTGNKIQ